MIIWHVSLQDGKYLVLCHFPLSAYELKLFGVRRKTHYTILFKIIHQ